MGEFSLPLQFIMGGLASCGAVTISNPFEVVKSRLQLQGELQKTGLYTKSYNGMFHAFQVIAKTEGIRGIQKGLFLAYPYTVTMNGTRLGLYPTVKTYTSKITGISPDNYFVGLLSGAITGVIGSVFANAFYVTKTRVQCSSMGPVSTGYQRQYKGSLDALKSIYLEEGFRGFFRGLQAATFRIIVASSTQLASYDLLKRNLMYYADIHDGFRVHFFASFGASMIMAVALNPFDTVLVRLQNQKVENGRGVTYSGWLDCFMKIARTERLYGFYKGFWPHYCRLGPHTMAIFVFLEQLKGLGRTLGLNNKLIG